MKKIIFLSLIVFSPFSFSSGVEEFKNLTKPLKGKMFAHYNKFAKANPGARGEVVLSVKIDAKGTITSCNTKQSEIGSILFESAMCDILKSKTYEGLTIKPLKTTYSMKFVSF